MRILFLNQYFPPDAAPTGVLLRELADELAARGHTVDFISAGQVYRAGQNQGRRMLREARALATMLRAGLAARRPDLVISGSSPPCLLVVAALVAARHRASSIHWVMDVYPDLAVALGELRNGLLTRFLEWLMGVCYRRTDCVVALDEDMAANLRRHRIDATQIRPWIFSSVLENAPAVDITPNASWTWIYSGNLGRAHEWETLLEVQALLEQRGANIELLFQGGGPAWTVVQALARELELKQCRWKEYASENDVSTSLLRCQCLVVTQRPATQGLLWPSKLGLVVTLPRPILWVGPTDGAIARSLHGLPAVGIFAPGETAAIADWLLACRADQPDVEPSGRFDPIAERKAALARWCDIVNSLETL